MLAPLMRGKSACAHHIHHALQKRAVGCWMWACAKVRPAAIGVLRPEPMHQPARPRPSVASRGPARSAFCFAPARRPAQREHEVIALRTRLRFALPARVWPKPRYKGKEDENHKQDPAHYIFPFVALRAITPASPKSRNRRFALQPEPRHSMKHAPCTALV